MLDIRGREKDKNKPKIFNSSEQKNGIAIKRHGLVGKIRSSVWTY